MALRRIAAATKAGRFPARPCRRRVPGDSGRSSSLPCAGWQRAGCTRAFLGGGWIAFGGPFAEFIGTQATASGLLLLSLVIALALVNGGASGAYQAVQTFPVEVRVGDWRIVGNLMGWVNVYGRPASHLASLANGLTQPSLTSFRGT
jgi:hypothetical protein